VETLPLKINEIFHSIQGESLLAGKPTVFIRTAACNLRCTWCDTRYSFWQAKLMSQEDVMVKVRSYECPYVCVTGGEPLGQGAVIDLLKTLLTEKFNVSLETNGSFSIKDVPRDVIKVIDIKCPESGEGDSFAWENLQLVTPEDQLKFVVASEADFNWSAKLCEEHSLEKKCHVLFSPVHGKVSPRDLARWILDANRPVTMQTQLHKEIWGSERGV